MKTRPPVDQDLLAVIGPEAIIEAKRRLAMLDAIAYAAEPTSSLFGVTGRPSPPAGLGADRRRRLYWSRITAPRMTTPVTAGCQ